MLLTYVGATIAMDYRLIEPSFSPSFSMRKNRPEYCMLQCRIPAASFFDLGIYGPVG
jgi:hypothetical protein